MDSTLSKIGLGLAIALLLCLFPMPFGYFTLVRFIAMVIFVSMAYASFIDNPEHMHPVQKEKESQIGSKRFDLNSHSGRYAPIFREK